MKEVLLQSGLFNEEKSYKLEQILDYIKENGQYARSYRDGEITDEDCDVLRFAYVDDDLYDYLEDTIAEYYIKYQEPIPYERKDFIFR